MGIPASPAPPAANPIAQAKAGGRRSVAAKLALLVAGLALAGGCATYTDRLSAASLAASSGDYERSLGAVTSLMGMRSPEDVPARPSGDQPVLLLDRGSLQQAAGRFPASQRDLAAAEQSLELLDLSTNGIALLAGYLYSDSASTYRCPPSEKLALNPLNLLNYLARGDAQGAAVEARRFQAVREYLQSRQMSAAGPDRLGAYLAGAVFERMPGEGDRALRYYDEALSYGPLASLQRPVSRLARSWPWRGRNLSRLLGTSPATGGSADQEILVVLALGRVPHKVPRRMPVGAALGVAGAFLGDRDLDILRHSATKVLVIPELVPTPGTLGRATVEVDGRPVEVELLADVGAAVVSEYEAAKPKILAAALSRMAARAAVSEGIRVAGNQGNNGVGDVLSLVVETALVAADRPDTRSWTMLPDRVLVARVPVAPGEHEVAVRFAGNAVVRTRKAAVEPGAMTTVVVSEPR